MKRIVFALLAFAAPSIAHADAVSERVFLTTGAGTCGSTNSSGFKRVKQMPDGSQIAETAEFVVPAGSYLEITNIEYTLPYWMAWAKNYSNSIDFNIRQRYGTQGTNILSARYHNHAVYAADENDNYVAVGETISPGAQTTVVAFPSGPLMSSAGRLCVTVAHNFYVYGGSMSVRGRLIPSGEIAPPPGGSLPTARE